MKLHPIRLLLGYAALAAACCLTTYGEPAASPVPAAATPAEKLPAVSETYKLTSKDVIHIKVFHEDDLETTGRISKDGSIPFPLLGNAKIGGETVQEATLTLEK